MERSVDGGVGIARFRPLLGSVHRFFPGGVYLYGRGGAGHLYSTNHGPFS